VNRSSFSLGLPHAVEVVGRAFPARSPARAALIRVLLGPRPWLHRLLGRSPGLVRRLHGYYGGPDFSRPCIIGFGSLPSRRGPERHKACGQAVASAGAPLQ
jgi:hypothetical protein